MSRELHTSCGLCFIWLGIIQTVLSAHHRITNSGEVRIPVEEIGSSSPTSTGLVGACVCFVIFSAGVIVCVTNCRQRPVGERIYDTASDRQVREVHAYMDLEWQQLRSPAKDSNSDYEYMELPEMPRVAASTLNQPLRLSTLLQCSDYLEPVQVLSHTPDLKRFSYPEKHSGTM